LRGAPAAFRRLCVETFQSMREGMADVPAAFRRLCVETDDKSDKRPDDKPSRL